jgi:hypothetical protein
VRTLTAAQYRATIDTQRELVRKGWHPAEAGLIVRRAVDRIDRKGCCGGCRGGGPCGDGLGIQQTRSLRRDLDPSIAPRPVIAGEQCVRIQEIPGNETTMYQQLDDYRSRGWNVMELETTKGWPSVRVFWACPPGRVPMESQGQVLASQAWGGPLRPGLGAEMVPTGPVAIRTGETVDDRTPPSILANVAAAGDDPTVAAARSAVSKWSWLIPVGGLLMSAKRKVSAWRSSPTDAALVKLRRPR